MYRFLSSVLPRPVVNALFALWYASLIILVYYFLDRDTVSFYYLHM